MAPRTRHAPPPLRPRALRVVQRQKIPTGLQGKAVVLPDWCQGDALRYFRDADRYAPRANSHLGKEIVLTLPRECSRAQNLALQQDFMQHLPANHPTVWALHEKKARNGRDLQPHAHVLVSPKVTTGRQQDAATFFLPPSRGGAPNVKPWATPAELHALRRTWDLVLRQHLRAYNLEHTLARSHGDKEVRLPWQEMRQLKQVLGRDFGHEHQLTAARIRDLRAQERITARQSIFLTQRATRQLVHEIRALAQHEQTLSAQRVPWYHVAAKRTLRREQEVAMGELVGLRERLQGLQELSRQIVTPQVERQQQREYARQQQRQQRQIQRHRETWEPQREQRQHQRSRGHGWGR